MKNLFPECTSTRGSQRPLSSHAVFEHVTRSVGGLISDGVPRGLSPPLPFTFVSCLVLCAWLPRNGPCGAAPPALDEMCSTSDALVLQALRRSPYSLFNLFSRQKGPLTAQLPFARNDGHKVALARVGQGIGDAACSPFAASILRDHFGPEVIGSAIGTYVCACVCLKRVRCLRRY